VTKGKPVAWLMREVGDWEGSKPRVVSGRMWVSEDAARAAAKRMNGGRWRREVFPVYEREASTLSPAELEKNLGVVREAIRQYEARKG
jgi:hypothetical protein